MDLNIIADETIAWMKDNFLPNIVKEDTFSSEHVKFNKIENCEVNLMGLAEAYMISMCFRIKLSLSDETELNKRVVGLIMKVHARCCYSEIFIFSLITFVPILYSLPLFSYKFKPYIDSRSPHQWTKQIIIW